MNEEHRFPRRELVGLAVGGLAAAGIYVLTRGNGGSGVATTARTYGGSLKHYRMANASPDFSDPATTARHNGFVTVRPWDGEAAKEMIAAQPRMNILAHRSLVWCHEKPGAGGMYSSFPAPVARQEGWLVTDSEGGEVHNAAWPSDTSLADIGNPEYAAAWADLAIRDFAYYGGPHRPFAGVYEDGTNIKMYGGEVRVMMPKYPDDAAWRRAVESGLTVIAERLGAAGYTAFPNIGSFVSDYATAERWGKIGGGWQAEAFATWHGGIYMSAAGLAAQIESVRRTQAAGKVFLGRCHMAGASDRQRALYGYCAMLMATSFCTGYSNEVDQTHEPPWFPEFDIDLGKPLGDAVRQPSGLWMRRFENSTVALNPTEGAISGIAAHTGVIQAGA
jgi:hypothetical protein